MTSLIGLQSNFFRFGSLATPEGGLDSWLPVNLSSTRALSLRCKVAKIRDCALDSARELVRRQAKKPQTLSRRLQPARCSARKVDIYSYFFSPADGKIDFFELIVGQGEDGEGRHP
jgi:hypothetical protein